MDKYRFSLFITPTVRDILLAIYVLLFGLASVIAK